MKILKLSMGQEAIVDNSTYEYLNKFKWSAHKNSPNTFYAIRTMYVDGKRFRIFLHKYLMNAGPEQQVDHINRNSLDNRLSNLRLASKSQNAINCVKKKTKKYPAPRGVYWHKRLNRWFASIRHNKILIFLGYFSTIKEATRAYNKAAIKYHKAFAVLNKELT